MGQMGHKCPTCPAAENRAIQYPSAHVYHHVRKYSCLQNERTLSPDSLEPLVVGPRVAWRLLGCSNTYGYGLLAAGELESYLDGRARKITMASIRSRIERRLAAAGEVYQYAATGHVAAPPPRSAAQAWCQDHTMIGEQSHAHDRAAVVATAIIQTIVTALRSRLDDPNAPCDGAPRNRSDFAPRVSRDCPQCARRDRTRRRQR